MEEQIQQEYNHVPQEKVESKAVKEPSNWISLLFGIVIVIFSFLFAGFLDPIINFSLYTFSAVLLLCFLAWMIPQIKMLGFIGYIKSKQCRFVLSFLLFLVLFLTMYVTAEVIFTKDCNPDGFPSQCTAGGLGALFLSPIMALASLVLSFLCYFFLRSFRRKD